MGNEDNQLNGFTFFRNYYNIVDNLPEADKQKMLVAIMDYVFKDKEPDFDGLLLAVFNTIRMGLDTSKNRAGNARNRGEKPSQNQKETNSKSKQNQKEIKTKSNENQKSGSDLSYSNSYSNSNILEKEGVGEKTFLEKPKNDEAEKAVMSAWNNIGLSCVKTLSKTRKNKIRLRVQELGLERVLEAIKCVPRSRFLMGDNKQHWTCSFDWLFTNDSNIVKVLEGNYEDHDVGFETSNPFLKSLYNDYKEERKMITVSQTKEVLAVFNCFYRRAFQDVSASDVEFMAKMWQRKLSPYEFKEVERAVDYITSRSKFMPSIAELIEVIEQNRNPDLKTSALEAWSHVTDAIRNYGYYDYTSAKEHLSERELEIVKQIGWNKLCMAEHRDMEFIKKDFIAMFDASKDVEMQELIDNHNKYINLIKNKTIQIEGGRA